MLGLGVLDERTEDLSAAHLEADGNELDALVVCLAAQCLPPGQVHAAASVGRPGHEDDFLAQQRRQATRYRRGRAGPAPVPERWRGLGPERLGADGRQPEVRVATMAMPSRSTCSPHRSRPRPGEHRPRFPRAAFGLDPSGRRTRSEQHLLAGRVGINGSESVRSGPLDIDQPRLGTCRLRHGRRPDCNSAPVLTWDDVGGVPKNSARRSRQSRASDDSLGLCPAIRDVVAVTGLLPARRDRDRSPDAATWQDLAS